MIRQKIRDTIAAITPLDALEAKHIGQALEWIDSGAAIFRIQKPDIPPQHLVAYFVIIDIHTRQILLVDHKKAQL